MTNESAHRIVRTWMIFSGYQSLFVPSDSNSHSANSSNSKRKGSDEGDASQSSGSSGKRNFVRSWTKDFPWLEYDGEKMQCKPCCSRTTESDSSSVFVTGSTNFKIESIRSHEKSNGHNRAVAAIKVAENPRSTATGALDCFSRCCSENGEIVRHCLLCRQERNARYKFSTSLPSWNETRSWLGKYIQYINDKAYKNFVLSIATQLKNELLNVNFRNADF